MTAVWPTNWSLEGDPPFLILAMVLPPRVKLLAKVRVPMVLVAPASKPPVERVRTGPVMEPEESGLDGAQNPKLLGP